ncbi:MAG TPA: sulfate permease [Thermomicrobiales bacterium]|jgi:sulfate permease, SulP family|nr:sulfate permease [Thermomicrobiales bacterium]
MVLDVHADVNESARATRGNRVGRLLPIIGWARQYDRSWLRSDVIAGVTVTALVVPKNLGYAEIARVPIENGLYAAAAGAILYGVFGTSRQISTGPSSALAAVAGSAVLATGISSEPDAAAIVAAIAVGAGLLFILLSVLQMGWIAQFISRAVITGFLFGAAIDVVTGELPKITGSDGSGDNAWEKFWSWLKGLDGIDGTTLLVGSLSLAALFGLRAVSPKFPGALVVVIGGLLASALFDLGDNGVALVGDVPRGLPSLVIPDLGLVADHALLVLVASVAIVMIGFSQSAGDARYFAAKNAYRVDINQESLAQGAANVGAGLFQGIPVSTSLSASSLNDSAGAKSQVATLTTGAAVVLTLIIFAPLFSDLPKAVLGAVIIEAVTTGMMDFPELRRLFVVKRSDFWIAMAAITGVVLAGVLAGVVIGVVLSLIWLLRVATSPAMPHLGRVKGTHVFREIDEHPDDERIPGVVALRLEGALFFVTADSLEDRIEELVGAAESPASVVVLDFQSVYIIDSQGAGKLGEIADNLRAKGLSFQFARVKPAVREVLERDGLVEQIGPENFFLDVNQAVEAYLAQAPKSFQ